MLSAKALQNIDAVKWAVRCDTESANQLSSRFLEDALSALFELHHRGRYLEQLKPTAVICAP